MKKTFAVTTVFITLSLATAGHAAGLTGLLNVTAENNRQENSGTIRAVQTISGGSVTGVASNQAGLINISPTALKADVLLTNNRQTNSGTIEANQSISGGVVNGVANNCAGLMNIGC